jgi:hypothetical protein
MTYTVKCQYSDDAFEETELARFFLDGDENARAFCINVQGNIGTWKIDTSLNIDQRLEFHPAVLEYERDPF